MTQNVLSPEEGAELKGGRQCAVILCCALAAALAILPTPFARASETSGPTFVLPQDAKNLPLTGPNSFCRKPDVVRNMLDAFSETTALKNGGEHAIDFINPVTIGINTKEETFSCHGVMRVSNGQMFPGTFSIQRNAAGRAIWNWMNDDSSTPYNAMEFEKEFVCPESLQDDASRENEVRKFMAWVVSAHPEDNTVTSIAALRVKLLQTHHCARTMANIQASVSDDTRDPAQVPAAMISRVASHFKQTLRTGGMAAVSIAIQSCYDRADNAKRTALAECILYDTAAYRLDSKMRTVEMARGLSPQPTVPFLSDQAFTARMTIYAAPLFGSPQATAAYFRDAPDTIIDGVTR